MLKRKAGLTSVLTITCLLLGASPAIAGEWRKTDNEQWQYIQDDGSKATGWLELDDERYYLDEKGNLVSNRWLKNDGDWYYLDKDGVMAKDTWVDNYHVDKTGKMDKKR